MAMSISAAILLLLIVVLARPSLGQQLVHDADNNSFSVAVRCSARAMEMFVQFREPFNGRLKTRPDGQCFVNGRGRLRVGFRLPLDERHMKKCSIVRREEEFIALVDLEMDPSNLVAADETSYFMRCPIVPTNDQQQEEGGGGRTIVNNNSSGNVGAKIAPLDAKMRLLAEDGGQMMNLSLDSKKGHKALLRQCIAFVPLAGPDGKPQAFQLGNQNGCLPSAAQQIVQFRRPDFVGKTDGKFFVQCEIVEREGGEQQEEEEEKSSCANSSSALPVHSLASIRIVHPFADSPLHPPPHLAQYLLATLLGVLLSLCLASACLIAVHFAGKYRNRPPDHGQRTLGARRNGPKRVQIVCPTTTTTSGQHCSRLSLSSSALSFGSSPIQQPSLFAHPPLAHFHVPSASPPSSSGGPPSPASTVTTALALSLDKLPEPPSLSLAEIRQLNQAFNGLLINGGPPEGRLLGGYGGDDGGGGSGVYSFAGIRLNSQFASLRSELGVTASESARMDNGDGGGEWRGNDVGYKARI